MAYIPSSGSVVAFQSNPSSLLTGASIYGQLPAGTAVLGSVATLQGTIPWIITGSVQSTGGNSSVQVLNFPTNQNVSGSIVAFQGGSWTPSVSGAVQVAGASPASIMTITRLDNQVIGSMLGMVGQIVIHGLTSAGGGGYVDVKVDPSGALVTALGSVVSFQGTTPWAISSVYGNISGSVVAFQGAGWSGSVAAFQAGTQISSIVSTVPSSVQVGASIMGQLPGGTAMLGSITALQGTPLWNISGSVVSGQIGTNIASVTNTIPSSLLTGNYAQRNDAVASFLGGNLTWTPLSSDSAGRILTKPFSPEDGTIISYQGSVVSTSVTLIQASAVGKKSYITDFWLSNTSATNTWVTLQDGSTSVIGNFVVPANGGSNSAGINIPLKTNLSQDLAYKVQTAVSVLYVNIKGYQAP